MKKVIFLILGLCLMASITNAAKSERQPVARTQPTAQPVLAVTTTPPVDAINLLYNEGYLTKEERDILLYSDYSTLSDGERGRLLSALRALWRRVVNSPATGKVVQRAFEAVLLYAMESGGGGGGGGMSPCPGSPYNPYMDQ